MHPHASLGPIDPQIFIPQPDGKTRQFAYEDVGAFLRFLESEAKITEQTHVSTIIDKLFSIVDPINVGGAKRASELSSSVGERLLLFHMNNAEDAPRAKQIAEDLNKSFFAHADAVSRTRAKALQLKIADPDPQIEKLMWDAYLGLEGYMEVRKPFDALRHYLADPARAAAVRLPAPAAIPPNTPPQIAQQLWTAVAQHVSASLGNAGVEVVYTLINAVIESTRVAAEFRTEGNLQAFRNANGEIQLSAINTIAGWTIVPPVGGAAGAPQ